eukprot:scaffold37611_cov35-Tisochrysis_lutea.AAC.5
MLRSPAPASHNSGLCYVLGGPGQPSFCSLLPVVRHGQRPSGTTTKTLPESSWTWRQRRCIHGRDMSRESRLDRTPDCANGLRCRLTAWRISRTVRLSTL